MLNVNPQLIRPHAFIMYNNPRGVHLYAYNLLYMVPQELRSLHILRDLIPELILSQKLHILMGPICKGSVFYEILKYSK